VLLVDEGAVAVGEVPAAVVDAEEECAVVETAVEEEDADDVDEPDNVGAPVEDPSVIPTARQRPSASVIAACKLEPVQAAWMHAKVVWTKTELLHRHVSSVALQPSRFALVMHEVAQSGNWRR